MQPSSQLAALARLVDRHPEVPEIWVVELEGQRLIRLRQGRISGETAVSTSRFGSGNRPGSHCTPLGWHRICALYGRGTEPGRVFRSRRALPERVTGWQGGSGDRILTRILWLDGLEPRRNGNSRSRFIYLHGTDQEEKLGSPASEGCIRLGNRVLAEWADALGRLRPLVWIGRLS